MTMNILNRSVIAIVGLVGALSLSGQSGRPILTSVAQTRPQAIPTVLTTVLTGDAYVCAADFTATGQNLLIEDNQATPIVWLNNTLGSGGSPSTWIYGPFDDTRCRWMPNGIQIQAGASGVTGAMVIKCPVKCTLAWGF